MFFWWVIVLIVSQHLPTLKYSSVSNILWFCIVKLYVIEILLIISAFLLTVSGRFMLLHLIKTNSILLLNTIHGVIILHCIDPLYCLWIFGVMLVFWVLYAQSCPTLCNPMECSPLGSSVHGILSRQKYWSGLPFPSPGYLSSPKNRTRWQAFFFFLTTEAPGKAWFSGYYQ